MAGRTDRKTLKAWLTPCRSGCREYAPPQRADPRPQQNVGEISGLVHAPLRLILLAVIACFCATALASENDWSTEPIPATQGRWDLVAINVQANPALLMSERVPELSAAFAAVIEEQSSNAGGAWHNFGSNTLTASSPTAPTSGDPASAGDQGEATGTGFCSTRKCRVLVGVSVAVAAAVLIVAHDATDAIGDGLVEALIVAPIRRDRR